MSYNLSLLIKLRIHFAPHFGVKIIETEIRRGFFFIYVILLARMLARKCSIMTRIRLNTTGELSNEENSSQAISMGI
jgi:hypothetical protein